VTDLRIDPARLAAESGPRTPCICESYARVTERAALAGARWLGRADQEAAEEAVVRRALRARVAADQRTDRIGRPRAQTSSRSGPRSARVGREVDLALDPLEDAL
jgi:fructose-1,6-bisphosphatase/sedoheptulose 1,7-bisphosphatase-like protein